jgi:hypothetical protein
MNVRSSQWLITFSDLFFILVSFFILRHELIDFPKVSSVYGDTRNGSEEKSKRDSPFKTLTPDQPEEIEIKVQNEWFSGESDLSITGDLELSTIKKMLETSTGELSLNINAVTEDTPESLRKKISILIQALLVHDIPLGSFTILQTSYPKLHEGFAEFIIAFPEHTYDKGQQSVSTDNEQE